MFPVSFRKRIEQQSYIDSKDLLLALEKPSPVTIRVNRNKWNHKPLNSRSVPWCEDGFYLESRPSFTFDPLFHAGCYYPQEASGMFLEEIFRQLKPDGENLKILDLCGAPGGKSTHLSALTGKNGFIVSNEVIRTRALILAENVTKWGLPNVIVTQSDPSSFGNMPGFFDIILVDAPCSGEGMFRDAVARNEWSEENAAMCSDRQKRIVMDAWPSLREEGMLIYSTCTFNPAENEENIKWLTGKKKAETIRLNISGFKGITEIEYKGIYGYVFIPGKIEGEGLFISVMRKKEPAPSGDGRIKAKSNLRAGKSEILIATKLFEAPSDQIIRYGEELIALPCSSDDYNSISKVLKIIKAGTRICRVMKRTGVYSGKNYGSGGYTARGSFSDTGAGKRAGFAGESTVESAGSGSGSGSGSGIRDVIPLHDLALSVNCKPGNFPASDLTRDQALTYLSRGQFSPERVQKGWNIVRYRGIKLGFINNIGSRINNYYPVDWRIRKNLSEGSEAGIIGWD